MSKRYFKSKKILLVLSPFKFTEFLYYKFELGRLKKEYNQEVIIHDLSKVLTSKNFNETWKVKIERSTVKFSSLISWIRKFNKIKKNNILIYDFLDWGPSSFKLLVIKIFLKLSKLPLLLYRLEETAEPKLKKDFNFFLTRLLKHKLNFKFYYIAFKEFILSNLIKCIKFDKIFWMASKNFNKFKNKKNIFLVKAHSGDYSNALLEKKKINIKKNKKYIVYLDTGLPYFSYGGDFILEGRRIDSINIEECYKQLNIFFDNLENIFKAKVIIVPHSKYRDIKLKTKNLIPYFNNRISDNSYNSSPKLISGSKFVVCQVSTAMSYAVINYKPVQFIYSPKISPGWNFTKNNLFYIAKLIGAKPINIESYKKEDLLSNLKVNKAKYDLYKYSYLTYKNANPINPNYKIIKRLMDEQI
tara:strand:+ start:975 stop:2216 length:1242 start_codon:yes stop_codon:yes gene_type:complete